jgi:hypothetical protein
MTNVSVNFGHTSPTHDISLSDGSTTYGLIYSGGPRVLQEVPLSPPAQAFENEQRNWIGGRGRNLYTDDPTGYFDDFFLWSTTEGKLMPSLQWRFSQTVRTAHTSLPGDNSSLAWWKLYGDTPASRIGRYLSIAFTPGGNITADKAYLIIRRRGTPGTLTFELCADSTGDPGTVLQTVTKTTSDITDTISIYQLFDWASTQALTGGTTYHIKIYGAATDSADSASGRWEVLGNSAGTASQYSAAGSAWTEVSFSLYFRVVGADFAGQWRFFYHEGALYAVSQSDTGATPVLLLNGVRGIATSATGTTLVCSALSMTADAYIGAYIRIYDGTGDGQVRQITDNDATSFTVATWDVTPDATSKFLVYGTDYWTTITGHGLTAITGKPVSTGTVCYFPQGGVAAIRRMRINGNTPEYAADSTNTCHLLGTHMEGATLKVVAGYRDTSAVKLADAVAWGTDLTLGAAKSVGTTDYRINNIYSHNKILYIFKEDGIYSYNNGIVEKLGNGFSDAPDRYMGVGVGAQNQYMWFGWSHSVERQLGSNIDDMLNYKRGYDGVPENRTGNISSIVSAVGWLFFVIDGGSSNYSSIVVWNGFGWHEIFRGWATGVRIRNAVWQPVFEGRGRLWFDIGGDVAYIEFPKYAANPLRDSSINYNWEGAIVTGTYDAHDQNLYKILSLLRVFTERGDVEVDYQTNANVGTTNWATLGTADSQPVEDLILNLGGVFQVRFRFRLQVTNTRTPSILTGWQLSGRMMPLSRYQYLGTFRADSEATSYSDEQDHDPNTLYTQLQTWAEQQTKLTFRTCFYSSDNKVVTIGLPSKSVDSLDPDTASWTGRISFPILET